MGKGAFTYEGGRSMPKSKSGLTGSGKMSSAHGLNSGNATKGMRHAEGRIGAGCKGFSSGIPGDKSPVNSAAHHAKQPSGHKSKA